MLRVCRLRESEGCLFRWWGPLSGRASATYSSCCCGWGAARRMGFPSSALPAVSSFFWVPKNVDRALRTPGGFGFDPRDSFGFFLF